jgi:hypothetical protein
MAKVKVVYVQEKQNPIRAQQITRFTFFLLTSCQLADNMVFILCNVRLSEHDIAFRNPRHIDGRRSLDFLVGLDPPGQGFERIISFLCLRRVTESVIERRLTHPRDKNGACPNILDVDQLTM